MLASVVFVPSAPLLVPAVAGPAADDALEVRAAVLEAGAALAAIADTWIAVGAADAPGPAPGGYASTGSFARFGVDVPVDLGDNDGGDKDGGGDDSGGDGGGGPAAPTSTPAPTPGPLPLSMLIAGWLRGESGATSVRPEIIAPDSDPAECARRGAELAATIHAVESPVGVLVVGDGSISLSARAPGGGLRESAVVLQKKIDDMLAAADLAGLAALDVDECAAEGVGGRAAWQVAAALAEGLELRGRATYADAPFGVGYVVADWAVMSTAGGRR